MLVDIAWFQSTSCGYFQLGLVVYGAAAESETTVADSVPRSTKVDALRIQRSNDVEESNLRNREAVMRRDRINGGIIDSRTLHTLDDKKDICYPSSFVMRNTKPIGHQIVAFICGFIHYKSSSRKHQNSQPWNLGAIQVEGVQRLMILAEKMMKLQLMKDASDGTTAPVISSRGMTMLGNPVANPVDNYLGLLRSTSSVQVLHRIHAQLLVRGFLGDPRLLSRFIGVLALSQKIPNHLPYSFLLLPHSPSPPTVYAYNTLIRAHSKSSPDPLAAFALYGQILRSLSLPDNYTFTFLIRASARLPSASAGAASHAAAPGADTPMTPTQSGLIHLYAGFGSATACRRIFGELRHRISSPGPP
ncbi:hypothetical protein HPP92_024180 [Vanilla planifolia]|uniref:Uncharacterized protein n=1 Tax=Vanilla planifolia TaxID=51239 RepID=A0A835PRQ1_VANPL|nr:hypothetical protein HPP92_024180 [Vanilla planifolia]